MKDFSFQIILKVRGRATDTRTAEWYARSLAEQIAALLPMEAKIEVTHDG